MTTLCARTTCTNPATHRLAAAGTTHRIAVCPDCLHWAKAQIMQDFPGRAVTCEFVGS